VCVQLDSYLAARLLLLCDVTTAMAYEKANCNCKEGQPNQLVPINAAVILVPSVGRFQDFKISTQWYIVNLKPNNENNTRRRYFVFVWI
jgi:hypothetical protein